MCECYESEKLSEGIGPHHRNACKGGADAPSFTAQLLRALQQLCAGISFRVFFHYGILL